MKNGNININPSGGQIGRAGLGGALDCGQAKDLDYQAYAQQQAQSQCANAPTPEREIPAKLSTLFAATDALSEKLARFEQRLMPVLVSVPESSDTSKEPYSTPMGEQLAGVIARVVLMIGAVDSMDARLEL